MFEKLPAVNGSMLCLTCGNAAQNGLEMDNIIAVGFGDAGYSMNGEILWQEGDEEDGYPTVADVEKLAAENPDNDWRIFFSAPLYDAEYQRQGTGQWVLVRRGLGFA